MYVYLINVFFLLLIIVEELYLDDEVYYFFMWLLCKRFVDICVNLKLGYMYER